MAASYTFPATDATTGKTLPNPAMDEREEEPRRRIARFGDGYQLRVVDGINALEQRFEVTWSPLNVTQKNTVVAFLRARSGVDQFYWTPPGVGETQLQVICPVWRVKNLGARQFEVSATFEKDFTP